MCDACGGKLVQRKDDDPETVRNRLEVYHQETEPLKDFYEAAGILRRWRTSPPWQATTKAILRCTGEMSNDHSEIRTRDPS